MTTLSLEEVIDMVRDSMESQEVLVPTTGYGSHDNSYTTTTIDFIDARRLLQLLEQLHADKT